jgi:hypothetical protein
MLAVGIVFLLLRIPLAQQYTGAQASPAVPALAQVAQEANHYSFWIGMLAVAAGGLLLCRVLLKENLVPRFLAVYGLAGYAIFLAGAILEILGHNVGVALSIPGGLFEIAFGILLIAKGFPAAQSSDYGRLAPGHPAAAGTGPGQPHGDGRGTCRGDGPVRIRHPGQAHQRHRAGHRDGCLRDDRPGGKRQRVAIARAIVGAPPVVLVTGMYSDMADLL